MTAYDLRVCIRAAALSMSLVLLAWLVTAATDEGGIGWQVRAGRTLPTIPVCSALACILTLGPARRRGEVRALESLGRTRWEIAKGPALGSVVPSFVLAVVVASANIDVSAFYPATSRAVQFRFEEGRFVDRVRGWAVEPNGTLLPLIGEAEKLRDTVPPYGRTAVALSVLLLGIGFSLLASHRLATVREEKDRWGIALVVLCILVTILVFHAAAANRLPALVAVLPAFVFVAIVINRYRVEV